MLSPRHTHRYPRDRARPLIEIDALDIPAIESELFLRDHLPRHAHLLEVGAGDGRLAARLARAGWQVTALDRSPDAVAAASARGATVACADFFDYAGGPFDAVLFSRSLHHMRPLAEALDRAATLLKPDGCLVLEEFAWERMDEATARWLDRQHLEFLDNGWVRDTPESGGNTDPLERWIRHHRDEHAVHTGADLARAVIESFEIHHFERPAYLFRHLCARVVGDRESVAAARSLVMKEEACIYTGAIQPIGFRIVARPRRSSRESR